MKKTPMLVCILALGLALLACGLQSGARQTPTNLGPISPAPSASAPTAAVGTAASAPANPLNANVGNALNLVIGTSSRPSVYPSYHIEVSLNEPSLGTDGKSIVVQLKKLSADVQGQNVHVLYNYGSEPTQEGYIIGSQEYQVTNGKAQAVTIGDIQLRWGMWPLDVSGVFISSALIAAKTGSDTLAGRPVDVYSMDTTANPGELQTLGALGGTFKALKGQIWIDKQTGGLLKASLDYSMQVLSQDASTVVGVGNGHLDLAITNIGSVTVSQP